jgi:TPR repeat protein
VHVKSNFSPIFCKGALIMTGRLWRSLLAGACLALSLGLARADRLDDNLQTVWESLWSQGGAPQYLKRWNKKLTYRIHGPDAARHRDPIEAALKAATQAAGIGLEDVSAQGDAETAAMLSLEVTEQFEGMDSMPCYTQALKLSGWALEKVQIKMRSQAVWRCAFHEVMHAMGVPGHPSGRTVLSYFPYRRDMLMDLDRLILTAWYSPAMRLGATPLEALAVLSRAVAWQTDLGMAPEEALGRAAAFNHQALAQMQLLASGEGEIPSIVLRSGRANDVAMGSVRGIAGYVVGMAYLRGVIAARDAAAASPWFRRSAYYGYSPGQVMWARALKDGVGVPADAEAAHSWFTMAHAGGNSLAKGEIEALEKAWSPGEIEKARTRPAPALAL